MRPQQARALVSGEVLCEEQAVDRLQQERCCSSAENANSIIQMVSSHDQENIGMFQRPSPRLETGASSRGSLPIRA